MERQSARDGTWTGTLGHRSLYLNMTCKMKDVTDFYMGGGGGSGKVVEGQ